MLLLSGKKKNNTKTDVGCVLLISCDVVQDLHFKDRNGAKVRSYFKVFEVIED